MDERQTELGDEPCAEPVGATAIFLAFLRLGLTSFGGPIAHIGYFRDEFVTRRRWLTQHAYADLVALCQFLPGPASSQVGMGIGLTRGGIGGALAAWLGFTLPSALIMIAAGYGVLALGTDATPGWLQGLKVVAVAVVAQAVWGMTISHASSALRFAIAVAAAIATLVWPGSTTQVFVILAAAVIGLALPVRARPADDTRFDAGVRRRLAILALVAFVALLAGLPLLASATSSPTLDMVYATYRSGALVFGGGHVILPLLDQALVVPGWLSENSFIAGYGLVQAVPGPLFSFSAYLGTAMDYGPGGIVGGVIALVAIFLPSFLLVVGILPFWDHLRQVRLVRRALSGVNAAVVGLLLAAFYDPVITSAIHGWTDLVLALFGLIALTGLRLPPWIVVALAAAIGAVLGLTP